MGDYVTLTISTSASLHRIVTSFSNNWKKPWVSKPWMVSIYRCLSLVTSLRWARAVSSMEWTWSSLRFKTSSLAWFSKLDCWLLRLEECTTQQRKVNNCLCLGICKHPYCTLWSVRYKMLHLLMPTSTVHRRLCFVIFLADTIDKLTVESPKKLTG